MISNEVAIGAATYSVGKWSALQQVEIVFKLGGYVGRLADAATGAPDQRIFSLIPVMGWLDKPAADAIVGLCLRTTQRREGAAWAGLLSSNGSVMFDDMDAMSVIRIVDAAMDFNLGPFFAELRRATSARQAEDPNANGSGTAAV